MAPKTLRFESLKEDHLSSILAIEASANSAPWSEKAFRNELNHTDRIFLVGLVGGVVAAYGGVWLVIDEAHVTTVAVSETHRRQGVGEALVRELLRRSKEAGMTCSTLEVRAGNRAAIDLYKKLGFQEVAVRKGYYPDNKEDAVVMWLYDLASWQ